MRSRGAQAGNKGQGSNWIRREKRLRIYARDGWRCVWCQCAVLDGRAMKAASVGPASVSPPSPTIRLATLDHFLPRGRGGDNTAGNLLTSCTQCNEERGDKPALRWAAELAEGLSCLASVPARLSDILARCLVSLDAPLLTLEERSAA